MADDDLIERLERLALDLGCDGRPTAVETLEEAVRAVRSWAAARADLAQIRPPAGGREFLRG